MQSAHKTALVWFRRGVRVRDNHALTEAVKSAETVVPVFILDPTSGSTVRFSFRANGGQGAP